jgi:hypothetical protein
MGSNYTLDFFSLVSSVPTKIFYKPNLKPMTITIVMKNIATSNLFNSFHKLNSNSMSSCVAQEENLIDNVRSHFEIDHTAPHASSSYISPLPHEPQSGFSYLMDLLLVVYSQQDVK